MTAALIRVVLGLIIFAALVLASWLVEGWDRMRTAGDLLDVYGTDDESVSYTWPFPTGAGSTEPQQCTDPTCGCEQGRAMYDGYVRLSRAMAEHGEWQDRLRAVARADAEQVAPQ